MWRRADRATSSSGLGAHGVRIISTAASLVPRSDVVSAFCVRACRRVRQFAWTPMNGRRSFVLVANARIRKNDQPSRGFRPRHSESACGGDLAVGGFAMSQAERQHVTTEEWEYQVIEEPNPTALRERLTRASGEGWEAMNLGYAGDCRLLALLRRSRRVPNTSDDKGFGPDEESIGTTAR